MTSTLDSIIIDTASDPEFVVIWLHGLGADGNDFVPIVREMNLSEVPAIRFIFPHAPIRPITVNGGMEMRGWYDIPEMDLSQSQDSQGIKASAGLISELIEHQISQGFTEKKIFLAGFSQGGAIALYAGLTANYDLAGIIALSTYIPILEQVTARQKPEIFYAHGHYDPIIPISLAEKSHEWLLSNDIVPAWHTYPMQHQVVMDEIIQINRWLVSRIRDIQATE